MESLEVNDEHGFTFHQENMFGQEFDRKTSEQNKGFVEWPKLQTGMFDSERYEVSIEHGPIR
jgi:hypothetical protein